MKKLILLILMITVYGATYAQNATSTASQTTNLKLNNAIELTFTGTGNNIGGDVNLNFVTVNEYANGVESTDQWLKVRSNKDYSITVKANDEHFSYSGNSTTQPQMKVKDVLGLLVSYNYTGGSIAHPYSATNYKKVSTNTDYLLRHCDRGGNQTFAVRYKATPGFQYPAGTYSVDVVYTATQD